MAKITKGTLNVGRTAYSDGKAVVTSVNGVNRDSTSLGYTVDSYTSDQLLAMISVLPISNYVPVDGVTSINNFVLSFSKKNSALLSGNYLILEPESFDLALIKANPQNSTFYVYITMIQGIPKYLVSATVIAEAGASAYNIFWIGTVTTNTTEISNVELLSRSRLDIFGYSTTPAGASFPVSTGLPSQSGTINW